MIGILISIIEIPIQHLKHNFMRWPINRKMKSPLKGDILFPF